RIAVGAGLFGKACLEKLVDGAVQDRVRVGADRQRRPTAQRRDRLLLERGRNLAAEGQVQAHTVLAGLELPAARDVDQGATQREPALAVAVAASAAHRQRGSLLGALHDGQVEHELEWAGGLGAGRDTWEAKIRGSPAERSPRLVRRRAQERLGGNG